MSPFGSSIERRDAREQRLLEQDDPEPRLARAGHADDHAVGREVARIDGKPSAPARRLGEAEAEVEVGHAPSLEPGQSLREWVPEGARPPRLP